MRKKIPFDFFDHRTETRGRKRKIPLLVHGGSHHMNYNPSTKRPLHTKKALHVVLKSKKATGAYSFKNKEHEPLLKELIKRHAKLNKIRIYSYSNGGNHLHLLIRTKSRDSYNSFIRTISGLIVRAVTGAKRGQKLKGKFWDGRPFSRVVTFGNDFKKVKSYLTKSKLEVIGWVKKIKNSKKLSKDWKDFWHLTCEIPI